MPTPIEFAVVLGSSAAVAAVVFLICLRCPSALRIALSFLMGVLAGHVGLQWFSDLELVKALGEPTSSALTRTIKSFTEPTEARLWIPALVIGGIILSLVQEAVSKPARRWVNVVFHGLWLAAFLGATLRLLWGSIYLTTDWTSSQAGMILGGIAVAGTVASVAGRAERGRGVTAFQLLMIAGLFGFSGLIFLMSGSKTIGMLTLSGLGSGLSVSALTMFATKKGTSLMPASVIVLAYGLHLMLSWFFAELTMLSLVLLSVALFLIMSFGRLPTRWPWAVRLALPVVVITAVLVTATTFAVLEFQKATQQQEEENPYSSIYG